MTSAADFDRWYADRTSSPAIDDLDLAGQLPEAGFVAVTDRPEWRVTERRRWEKARRVPAVFERRRRVLATASAPH
ncbi:hypothetical protein ACFWNN_36715 [Lentzea sp. NPDC058450]|uniref:hypothetical protein n=1 Tax=Lentzea sp. NPDC058450 TaxID=3346505 RepID=UPI0036544E16